ncbi:ATP-grasp domain-containing protein [Streptomyces sp. URMC 123]|uniref:ATP-grasp domain-containing protein n=1 Tax=Streptomyces sp. URMC 123 TaxID=3423403 RepID=UPI003F1A3529
MSAPRPVLLMADDRPTSFTSYVAERHSGRVVLLRFEEARGDLTEEYLRRTAWLPVFWLREGAPLDEEAARYRAWTERLPGPAPTRFCNPSEPRQAIAQRFAALAGLPHLSERQVRWVRDKVAMKDRFRELGLRTAEYARLTPPTGPTAGPGASSASPGACTAGPGASTAGPAASSSLATEVERFAALHGWPVVLKPVDSFACVDTHLLRGPGALNALDLPDRAWMVESFLGGTEWEACALIAGGEVVDVWPSAMPCRPLDIVAGALNANISVGTPGQGPPVDVAALVRRIVTGMGLDHGYLHMEFFVDGGEVYAGEVGLRPAGCEIVANHGHAYGFDVFGATLDAYLGRRPVLTYGRRRCVGDLLLPLPGSGRVVRITSRAELLRLDGVIEAVLRVRPGDRVSARRASNNASGYVHVVGDSAAEVESRMRRVLDAFTIELVPDAGARGTGSGGAPYGGDPDGAEGPYGAGDPCGGLLPHPPFREAM